MKSSGVVAATVLVLAVVLAFTVVVPLLRRDTSNGETAGTAPVGAVPVRFRVEFQPPDSSKVFKIDLDLGYAFVPHPGSKVRVRALDSSSATIRGEFSVYDPASDSTAVSRTDPFVYTVPESAGLLRLKFASDGSTPVHLFCLVPGYEPRSAKGIVRDRNIGAYGDPASGVEDVRKYSHLYRAPRYFVDINETTESLNLSPRVRVGDLVALTSKENPTRHVNFAPVCYPLIAKIEAAWRVFSAKHPEIPQWRYISWFRSPAHNKGQGGATFSRHPYGDACDIIVDLDYDWRMDDLNGDGASDMKDAVEIVGIFEDLEAQGAVTVGGLGAYEYPGPESTGSATHIDARGYLERWGYSWMSGRKREKVWYREHK